MKVFDFNIHLPDVQNDDVNLVIERDMSLNVKDLSKALNLHNSFIQNVTAANFLLFNTNLLEQASLSDFKIFTNQISANNTFTCLIDFRRKDIYDYLELVKSSGIKFIMVNSYLQNIIDDDFSKVLEILKVAEEKKLGICIDASYGTSKMYRCDNLKLACYIADTIKQVPIIVIHSGGYRIIEAMLLAADKKNVWLDTSFSLPYYINSSLEADFAFCYKKIGSERVIYGSDYPYENSEQALQIHMDFFIKYKFSNAEIENILFNNSQRLINID